MDAKHRIANMTEFDKIQKVSSIFDAVEFCMTSMQKHTKMIINNKKMKMITEKVPIDMRVNEEKTEQHPQRDS